MSVCTSYNFLLQFLKEKIIKIKSRNKKEIALNGTLKELNSLCPPHTPSKTAYQTSKAYPISLTRVSLKFPPG